MDKFRKQYALQKKYRQSVTQQSVGSSGTVSESLTLASKSDDNKKDVLDTPSTAEKHNIRSRPRPTATSEKVKLYASSSVTASTASSSFDSGDVSSKQIKSIGSSNKISNAGYRNGGTITMTESSSPKSGIRNISSISKSNNNNDGGSFAPYLHTGNNSNMDKRKLEKHVTREQSQYHALAPTDEENVPLQDTRENGFHGTSTTPQNPIPVNKTTFNKVYIPLSQKFQQLDAKNKRAELERLSTKDKHLSSTSTPLKKSSKVDTPQHATQTHKSLHMAPTEAQLRWAQFHQRKRALETKALVQNLMQYPQFVQQVDGAQDGDGDSSINSDGSDKDVESNGNTDMNYGEREKYLLSKKRRGRRKRMKVKLSRGRRALLRVSARRTEERRLYISKHGYSMSPDDECSDDDEETNASSHHQSAATMDDTLVFDEIDDALHVRALDGDMSVLTDEHTHNTEESVTKFKDLTAYRAVGSEVKGKKKSRKKTRVGRRLKGMRSMVRTADEDEERMKRFEDAYALMCSVGKEMSNESNIAKPTKRWSRASHVPVAVSIDGRVYDDLQRSPAFKHVPSSKRYGPEVVGAELNGSQLADRGASWMVHLPKQDKRSLIFFGQNVASPPGMVEKPLPEVISPSQLKLMEIVDRLQMHNSDSSPSHPVRQRPKRMSPSLNHPFDETSDIEKESPTKLTKERTNIFKPPNLFVSTAVEKIKQQKILTPFKVGVNVKNIRNRFLGVKGQECTDNMDDIPEETIGEEEGTSYLNQQDSLSPSMFEAKKIQKVVAAQVKSGQSVIDTDNQSQISEGMDALQRARIGSLMLSPTILTKRLNQAISAIEMCHWEQVNYLISANPWLAEMTDVNSEQFLLHKLAFHGGGTVGVEDGLCEIAPTDLNDELVNASMSSIHKFDINGNLPLHMAAEAGNEEMVNQLSKIFPGGASVRNKDGLLPLHLSVLACGNPLVNMPLRILSRILELFPAALAIADNDGNLPIHLATAYLTGDIGACVVHMLVDEAEKQGDTLRFPSDIITLANIDDSTSNIGADFDESNDADHMKSILFVKNSLGLNPLITAIEQGGGWEILDALLSRDGIEHVAFEKDGYGRNILQLTISQEPCDPPSILSILKAFPDLVIMRDADGALPIEIACLYGLQAEVIMAIALLDLPIDLDGDVNELRDGFGGSWWFLNCDCDDMFLNIVREILEICDYQQKRALCFTRNRNGNSLISRASPKCKQELRKTLRFSNRYEFIGSAIHSNEDGVKVFEALDFGTDDESSGEEGRKVTIKYYGDEETYNHATRILREINLDDSLFAEMRFFEASTSESHAHNRIQRCIAIESPILTLRTIVSSMAKKNYRTDQKRLDRYLSKTRKVFRMIGESIEFLHDHGVIHGHLMLEFCGKFDDGWKLIDIAGAHNIGESMPLNHTNASAPPESVTFGNGHSRGRGTPAFREEITASPSLDIWAFGKLMYEVLIGENILPIDPNQFVGSDERYLYLLGNWNEESLKNIVADVEASGEGALVADLISHCLCPQPDDRPKSMQDVLSHAYWNSTSSNRRTNSAMRHGGGMNRRFQM